MLGEAALRHCVREAHRFSRMGGTKVAAALSDLRGQILAEVTEPTVRTGATDLVAQLGRMTSMLSEQAEVPRSKPRVGAVGVPAAVHPETADLSLAGNLPGLEGANLRAALAKAMGVDVLIDNNVNLALLAEVGLGSAREFLVNPTGWQGDILGTLPTRQLFGDINPLRRTPLCVCF